MKLDRLRQGEHLGLGGQQQLVSQLVFENRLIASAFSAVADVPNAWIGAGVIYQNIWNIHHEYPINSHIKDIDVLYYDDSDLSWEAENRYIESSTHLFDFDGIPLDLKNIARVHLWYEERFGINILPYRNVEASVSTWPVMGSCMAVRQIGKKLEFCAPYGFQDALAMIVRPNKVLASREVYENKALRWKMQWPMLKVFDW